VPVTPGEMLKDEFLAEYGLSQNRLAKGARHFAEPDCGYHK
jgi:plasmid maintenance system antidote protein VapI